MKVVIAGASGFLGRRLSSHLKLAGWEIVALERHRSSLENVDRVAKWDAQTADAWVEELDGSDALINLSGKNVSVHWSEKNRQEIRESRVVSTQLLGEACGLVASPPSVWLNMSGINYYRANLEDALDESGPSGSGFLAEVVQDWEKALFDAPVAGVRRIAFRTAPVLGHGGGAFDVFEKLAKWFIGGSAGSGRQWVSWIHVEDWVRLAEWAITPNDKRQTTDDTKSVYNACSPEPARNRDFMAELRRALHRPWAPPAPAFAIKLLGALGGPDPSLALEGFRVLPQRALQERFDFRFPSLKEAFRDLGR